LRAARLDPEFLASIEVVLLEASVGLRKQQAASLETPRCPVPVRWVDHLDETLSDRPLFLLANEFFDALPIRQSVLTERGWCERMGVADGQGGLAFAASPVATMLAIPSQRGFPEAGAIYETSPAAEAIVAQIAHIIVDKGGAALIVDYGYGVDSGFAETLQAIAEHKFTNVLDNPGEADLSAHVDFGALARVAVDAGAKAYGPIEQGEFLSALGIVARAERLSRNHLQSVERQLNRLLGAEEMGTLFKALAIMPKHAPVPAGF
jgi:NADH dehydrogenase [ubiquinone] 1 alpha subcomplex assembly factor 7